MLKRSIVSFAFILISVMSFSAMAEIKVGFYDNRKILENLPEVKKQFDDLNAEFEPKRKKITDLQNQFKTKKEKLEKDQALLSPADLQSGQLDLQRIGREYQLTAEDTERVLKVRQNEIVRAIQQKIEQEVVKLAKEQNYDLILRSGVIYVSTQVDITKVVLERLSAK